jgi:hypothetical protein
MKTVLVFFLSLACMFRLQAITYQEWKAQEEKHFGAYTEIQKETSLLKSIDYNLTALKQDPENSWHKTRVLYAYNFFREMMQFPTVHSVEGIDTSWLNAQSYRLWKLEKQADWTKAGKTTTLEQEEDLVWHSIYNLEELKKNPHDTWHQKYALYYYNFLREMMKLPIIHSPHEIDTSWLGTASSQVWKALQKEQWEKGKATFLAKIKDLLFDLDSNLTSVDQNPQDIFYHMKALYSYNFLRELLAKASAPSLSQLDHQWVEEVKERIDPYVIMERYEAQEATAAQNLLVNEAQRILGLKKKIIAFSYPYAGKSIGRTETSYVFLCETPDLDAQLGALYHELGHIVHNDTFNSAQARSGETTYDKLLADKDFVADSDRIDRYTTIGKKAFTDETRIGKHINEILKTHKTFWIEPAADKLKEILFNRGKEKRADLYELDSLFNQKQISPILQEIVSYGESDYIVAQSDEDVHPSHIERALYFAGYLVDKGVDINKSLKDWYTTGKCKLAGGLPSLDFVQSLFPGAGSTQGARDVEKAYTLWLQQEKRKQI